MGSVVFKKMKRALDASGAFAGVKRVLAGVSGGVDSAVLLHELAALRDGGGPEVVAAHVHHHVRGEEADRDAAVAEKLARMHGCDFHVLHLAKAEGSAKAEHALRDLRLESLQRLAKKTGAARVVLAHQKDDQAETVLLRLLSGTDLRGLSAIRVFRPPLWVRPLLEVTRAEIVKEAELCGLPYAEDSTNRDTYPRRNFIRRNLMPMLKAQMNPQVTRHLAALSESMANVAEFMETQSAGLLSAARAKEGGYLVTRLRRAPAALRHTALQLAFREAAGESAVLRRVQLAAVDRLALTDGDDRTFRLPHKILAVRSGHRLVFTPLPR